MREKRDGILLTRMNDEVVILDCSGCIFNLVWLVRAGFKLTVGVCGTQKSHMLCSVGKGHRCHKMLLPYFYFGKKNYIKLVTVVKLICNEFLVV